MNYNVIPVDKFKRDAKRLVRKYPSLKEELVNLEIALSANPNEGTSLGNNIYKIRLAIQSKGKGKSGGARVITYLFTEKEEVYLLTIYDKAEFDTMEDNTIKKIIDKIKGK